MRIVGLVVLVSLGSMGCCEEKEDNALIPELIAQLGNDCFDKRQAAEQRLLEIGTPASVQIEKACFNTDPEVRFRALRLRPSLPAGPYMQQIKSMMDSGVGWTADVNLKQDSFIFEGHLKVFGVRFDLAGVVGLEGQKIFRRMRIHYDGSNIWTELFCTDDLSTVVKTHRPNSPSTVFFMLGFDPDSIEFVGTWQTRVEGEYFDVLQGMPKTEKVEAGEPHRFLFYFSKVNGLLMQTYELDKSGIARLIGGISNLKMGVAFKTNDFVYLPAPNAIIEELKAPP